jgi:hypothetical protein
VSWATSQLERLRDRAVSALAYEFAARVQAEIEGLSWISSPQRVTSMDAANLTTSGWSAGMLARFRVRNGRSAADRSGHAAWPPPPRRWPPPRRPGQTSPSATPYRPRAWLSLHSTTRTTRHTPRPGSGHAEHPFRRQSTGKQQIMITAQIDSSLFAVSRGACDFLLLRGSEDRGQARACPRSCAARRAAGGCTGAPG